MTILIACAVQVAVVWIIFRVCRTIKQRRTP